MIYDLTGVATAAISLPTGGIVVICSTASTDTVSVISEPAELQACSRVSFKPPERVDETYIDASFLTEGKDDEHFYAMLFAEQIQRELVKGFLRHPKCRKKIRNVRPRQKPSTYG